jgi:hypothetical protein
VASIGPFQIPITLGRSDHMTLSLAALPLSSHLRLLSMSSRLVGVPILDARRNHFSATLSRPGNG